MLEIWGLAVGLTGGAGYQHRIPIHGNIKTYELGLSISQLILI